MTTTTRERMLEMLAADAALKFSDVDQDVFAPVEIQGQQFAPDKAQEFINAQPFSRT